MDRSLLAVCFLIVGGVLSGCGHGATATISSIPARDHEPTNGAIVTGVRCVTQGHTVLATGTVTKNNLGRSPNLVTYGGLRVFVYDASGHQIGFAPHRLGSGYVETSGQVQHFRQAVSVQGTPASCDLNWEAGFPGGVSPD
jgi:hypothetical protein